MQKQLSFQEFRNINRYKYLSPVPLPPWEGYTQYYYFMLLDLLIITKHFYTQDLVLTRSIIAPIL